MKNKVYYLTGLFIKMTLLIALIGSFFSKNWVLFGLTILTFLLINIPYMFKKKYKIIMPRGFEFAITILIYGSLFLGEYKNIYYLIWWWDLMLHGLFAMVFGLIGLMILIVLYKEEKIKGSAWIISLFSFSFSLAILTVWEIIEFLLDSAFGWDMLKSGVPDIMSDLIIDVVGALIIAIAGYIYIKGNKSFIVGRWIESFKKENIYLFKKKKLLKK